MLNPVTMLLEPKAALRAAALDSKLQNAKGCFRPIADVQSASAWAITLDVRDRRIAEAGKGTYMGSLWAFISTELGCAATKLTRSTQVNSPALSNVPL